MSFFHGGELVHSQRFGALKLRLAATPAEDDTVLDADADLLIDRSAIGIGDGGRGPNPARRPPAPL